MGAFYLDGPLGPGASHSSSHWWKPCATAPVSVTSPSSPPRPTSSGTFLSGSTLGAGHRQYVGPPPKDQITEPFIRVVRKKALVVYVFLVLLSKDKTLAVFFFFFCCKVPIPVCFPPQKLKDAAPPWSKDHQKPKKKKKPCGSSTPGSY
jgi:hypothetical protein